MFLGGITFGLVAAYLYACPPKVWFAIALLTDAIWYGSVQCAIHLIQDLSWNVYLAMAMAGLLGGVAVAASTGIGHRGLLSMRVLGAAAIAGALAALPLGWWEHHNEATGLIFFPLWQAAVGTTMWVCSPRVPAFAGSARNP